MNNSKVLMKLINKLLMFCRDFFRFGPICRWIYAKRCYYCFTFRISLSFSIRRLNSTWVMLIYFEFWTPHDKSCSRLLLKCYSHSIHCRVIGFVWVKAFNLQMKLKWMNSFKSVLLMKCNYRWALGVHVLRDLFSCSSLMAKTNL